MEIAFFKEVLEYYGPLCLGWVVAWIIYTHLRETVRELFKINENVTAANVSMTEALKELRKTIENIKA